MKSILGGIGDFLLSVFKKLNWQAAIWSVYESAGRKKLLEYVQSTKSKWDDVMFRGVDRLLEVFLKPKPKVEEESK